MSAKDLIIPERTAVMGIVNVTEDSFSDGGRWLDVDAAIDHARDLVAAGADIIDVGGESTRPGATRVDPDVERSRVIPVIRALSEEGIATSIDTMRASVAAAAAEAGVKLINDVSGGLADRAMYSVMADTQLPVCLMHWKTVRFGDAAGSADHGGDVVADVHQTLDKLVTSALNAGVKEDNITIDPGLGFAKTQEDNWALLRALPEFIAGPYPVLVGASRKRFLMAVRAARGLQSGPVDADPATAAVTAIAAHMGAWCVRVHEVAVSRDAVDVAALWNA
ncbi:dihydropteroate synthase [Corynebacterium diphtheriae bv. mitis]|uniref:dihydropteroate synthase n=1 Tax=Corynebacterium diphtheriae TaxID=1717 RepID=UPI000245BB97|nr:dihydropteroate synthase [Corynebacterium diphtheriae]AEX47155.1 putative dihydropteroate synthase [Corynebacterium diphtheriae INCA 402]KLN38184.1 dihydropteroate synthase [Corynebacterium diphtheriae bv. gravis str. ISS 4060]MBG9263125.1 dihydropteroate synthase [Corynebacterium diphtheriae bv. gravis]MBG9358874.1 dihydropteroate synthase [Corynebacterium diphtheriae bv. mitis]MBG9361357.1 dihydropteroate synthase [Corynebacterium diphtheriae bv. mitis]